jgi:signal transduction histidine kinase
VEEALRWLPDAGSDPPEPGEASPSPSRARPLPGDGAGRRARILWADDNADMRDYVRRLLSQHWTVETAGDGQAALEAVRARRPDLVLTDVMMPQLDGFDLLRALRADPGTRSIPVVLVSARAGEESRVEGLEAGADDYLVKPFSARELIARVSALLELARIRQEMVEREQAGRRQAEQASRARDEFLAMLGHELRNPLGAIGGAVSVLGLLAKSGDEAEKPREIIRRQTAHLTRLLDDLLDVTRLDTGKIELQRRPLDLRTVAERALTSLAEGGKAAQHAITLTGETLWVEGDPTRLEQVIFNLLDNAVKYTPPGGQITLAMEADGGAAALRVTDTGTGMTPEALARAFEPFVQADPTLDRARGGLGLGLTLVKRFVELHGGTISAHSPGLGRGTEFLMRLPLTDARGEPEASPPSEAVIGPRRVLLIDDNGDMRTTLRLLLQHGGHHVNEAADGVQGLEMVLRLRPDVAFIDLGLPGRDGYELAQAVRKAPSGESLYLVALTGYGQPQDRRRALEVGFDAYLVKPVSQDDLVRVLAAAPAGR